MRIDWNRAAICILPQRQERAPTVDHLPHLNHNLRHTGPFQHDIRTAPARGRIENPTHPLLSLWNFVDVDMDVADTDLPRQMEAA
jgi:hypothetical protein